MKRLFAILVLGIGVVVTSDVSAQVGTSLFQENFDALTLGPSVNERQSATPTTEVVSPPIPGTVAHENAFTHTPPAGWVVEQNFDNFGQVDLDNPSYAYGDVVGNIGISNAGSPIHGTEEWEGWSFTHMGFWLVADDQNRSFFTNSSGNFAVADSDEYDDFGSGRGGGYYNTGMTTAPINVAGKSNVEFSFDSSWRDETFDDAHTLNPALGGGNVNNQTVVIYASFDDADPVKVTQWHSDINGAEFKDDAENENLSFPITVPAGAQNMKITMAYLNAGNDWWWAVDNLEVREGANPAFWNENFDSLTLGPSVNERLSRYTQASSSDTNTTPLPNAFTHTPPAGWTIDNSLMGGPPVDDDFGVFEWEGWTFTTNEFSIFTGNTQLAAFTKSTGNHAAADSDAYYPLGSASPLSTILETPNINITGLAADDLKLQFDSAWQTSGAQSAVVTVDYGNGEVTVLDWRSDAADPLFHATDLNETVFIDLDNPAGATTAKVRFKYLDGSNNWFWAIDNIKIGTTAATLTGDFNSDGIVDAADYVVWRNGLGTTHTQAEYELWRANFGRTAAGGQSVHGAVPEPMTIAFAIVALMVGFVAGTRMQARRTGDAIAGFVGK